MPSYRRSSVLLLSLILLAPGRPGVAQDSPRPLPEPQPMAGLPSRPLLEEPAVRREIGLSEKQKNNLLLLEEERAASRGAAGDGEGGFDFNALMNQTEEIERLHRAALGRILTSSQKTRLLQLEWQREGWFALGRPDLGAKLDLSAFQAKKIRGIIDLMRRDQALAALGGSADRPDPKAAEAIKNLSPANGFLGDPAQVLPGGGPLRAAGPEQAKMDADRASQIQGAAAREVAELLKPEQRAALDRLLGPPFDFRKLDPTAPATPPARRSTRPPQGRPKAP